MKTAGLYKLDDQGSSSALLLKTTGLELQITDPAFVSLGDDVAEITLQKSAVRRSLRVLVLYIVPSKAFRDCKGN